VFGFPSYFLKAGSFDIREAANRLHLQLKTQGVLDYPAIVFVAHSMGGLVVMRELLTNRRHPAGKCPSRVLRHTDGGVAHRRTRERSFSPNSALAQNDTGGRQTRWLQVAERRLAVGSRRRPPARALRLRNDARWARRCRAVVERDAILRGRAPPAIEASHITIVKPDRPGADAILDAGQCPE
jgi:hypothetical protein